MSAKKMVVAVKSILTFNKQVLLLQRADSSLYGPGIWEFPGGKIEFSELLEDAILREIQEETGIHAIIEQLLYAATVNVNPTRHAVIINYLCKAKTNTVLLSSEHKNYVWAGKNKMMELLDKDILHNLEKNNIFSFIDILP